ncbi:MAG: DNA polymerase I, partial [Oscillospiraceae bacterium]|nr:DNA polymerase I [Oscillospiraceae bacterium]
LKEVLDAMNIPRYELEGWEADDLLGTISVKCAENGWECVIVTGDKDSLQLVTETTRVNHVKSRMGQTETKNYTVEAFTEEYGFAPIKLIDLKALMGDTSDNIPGVAGVGEKTAMALVQRFGGIADIYENLSSPEIKESVRKRLDAGRDAAKMSYELATIRCDAPIDFDPKQNIRVGYNNDALYKLFRKLDFNKLIEKFELTPSASEAQEEVFEGECVSHEVVTADDADAMLKELRAAPCVSVTAAEDLSVVTVIDGSSAYILRADGTDGFKSVLSGVFAPEVRKASHNVKDLIRRLLALGVKADGFISDTALAAYLLQPSDSDYSLPALTKKYAHFTLGTVDVDGTQLSIFDIPDPAPTLIVEAAAIDLLRDILEEELNKLGMLKLYSGTELPLCRVLANMEHDGVYADRLALSEFGTALSKRIDELAALIYELAGEKFNINSPKQL